MKTKKLGLTTVIVLSVVFLFALNASAAWYTCTVVEAGPSTSNFIVKLTDKGGAFTNRYFILHNNNKNGMLAAALSAASGSMSVAVNLSSSATWSTVYNLYLKP